VQGESVIAHDNRMSGVCTTAVSYDNVAVLCEDIYDFTFTFIAPLQSDNAVIHLYFFPFIVCLSRVPGGRRQSFAFS
jgi:hypothetical protein